MYRYRRAPLKIRLSPELLATIHNEANAFEQHYGRKPLVTDPVFFDPNLSGVQPLAGTCLHLYLNELSRRTGLMPAKIYAYHKLHRHGSYYDRMLWSDALSEYETLSRIERDYRL